MDGNWATIIRITVIEPLKLFHDLLNYFSLQSIEFASRIKIQVYIQYQYKLGFCVILSIDYIS